MQGEGTKCGKKMFFDETNPTICCKQRIYLFRTAKTNWFLGENEPHLNAKKGVKMRLLCAIKAEIARRHSPAGEDVGGGYNGFQELHRLMFHVKPCLCRTTISPPK